MLEPLLRGLLAPPNHAVGGGLGVVGPPDVTPPTLSNATDGTPTGDGAINATVDTNETSGVLYWAVVTNGGSCTDAQLKAGSGGNIVPGVAGNQAVVSTGTQTVATITGLDDVTTYQIKYLHRDGSGNDSSQASVSLTTTDITAPILSSPTDGTPTNDGTVNATVTTDEGNGTLYWVVVTDGGSATDAQIKAGTGGDIVEADNQAVVGTGVQTVATITGLDSLTTYQILFLHSDTTGNDSDQVSVDLTTTDTATGWFAGANSTDGGNNVGWTFTAP